MVGSRAFLISLSAYKWVFAMFEFGVKSFYDPTAEVIYYRVDVDSGVTI